ncbi:FAD-binding oxidoreductase [Desulfococcaceae bacterium HSG9]|nr:FAD-binding oxidoreductase [Desulfococcaceae bacterium HSG9]
MQKKIYDVIIVGGGVIGSSTAYNLMLADHTLKVAVIEKDPTYTRASTTLSLANARIQFSLKQNIQISQYAFDILDQFEEAMAVDGTRPSIALRREGNLFLLNHAGREVAEKSLNLQKSLGCQVEWWSPDKIRRRFPIYAASDFAGATFGPYDGHFDAYSVLMGYKAKAQSMGVRYISDEAVLLKCAYKRITGVQLGSGEMLQAGYVINCAGAWAAQIAQTAGVELPVVPVKRQVFALDTEHKPKAPLPLTILPSGFFFRSETGNLLLLGKSMSEDPVGFDFTYDEDRFMEILWPELVEFAPVFEAARVVNGWAGLYAVNTLDGNAVLGEWPELKGFFLANGFSGHGLQQAPAVGRYLAELICGRTPALDLSIFQPQRILTNQPLSEDGLV